MNYDPADPMGDGLGGYGPQFRRSAAHQLILGNHWVAEHWLRLSLKQGRELEREVDLIKAEQRCMIEISRAVAILQRRRPYEVESWISDPPFPGRFTYIPVIKDVTELVTADMMQHADFSFDVQDHNLYVVTPYLQGEWTDPPLGIAYTYGATPGTPAPTRTGRPFTRVGGDWTPTTRWSNGCCACRTWRSEAGRRRTVDSHRQREQEL